MRWATPVFFVTLLALGACNDVRDFRGTWQGARVGDTAALRVGAGAAATLAIDEIDGRGIQGRLAIDGLLDETRVSSIPGAEADALANMTFAGNPFRVYLCFVAIGDGSGDALVLIALYDDQRIEVRLLRSGASPLYAIFALQGG